MKSLDSFLFAEDSFFYFLMMLFLEEYILVAHFGIKLFFNITLIVVHKNSSYMFCKHFFLKKQNNNENNEYNGRIQFLNAQWTNLKENGKKCEETFLKITSENSIANRNNEILLNKLFRKNVRNWR